MAIWHPRTRRFPSGLTALVLGAAACAGWAQTQADATQTAPNSAEARLVCLVTYAGSTQEIVATPTREPYRVPAVDIAGRFSFKAVMVGQGQSVSRINLSVYAFLGELAVPIQHATYLPSANGVWPPRNPSLTGLQRLYAGPLERELMYECQLTGAHT